jgi:hypothetical protein
MRHSFLFAIDDNAYCGVATRNGVAIKAIKTVGCVTKISCNGEGARSSTLLRLYELPH